MRRKSGVLVIDDVESHARAAAESLERIGYTCEIATSGEEGLRKAGEGGFDIVITDLVMPDLSGLQVLERLKARDPSVEVVVITGKGTIETAVEAIQKGAATYIQKPLNIHELRAVVQRLSEKVSLVRRQEDLRPPSDEEFPFDGLVGACPAMREAIAKVRQVAPTDATVLIYGETGTGKELVARALHDASPRRHRPFVALNCAALSEGIIESELFGHQRGSFTGAVADRTGRIEYANHGTLFLDEVADMPTSTQVKLLRVLEQGEITPIGSNKIVRVDVRVVAATHRRLDGEVQAGKFRSDLYYRLKVVTVELPPLRERREDIPLLATDFLAKAAERHGRSVPQLTPAVFEALSRYEWPGNVRELKNVIENIVVTTQTPVTDLRDLPENLQPSPVTSIVPVSTSVPQTMESAEIIAIRNALMTTGGKREEAAKLLGIGERTLYRKIRKYNL